MIGEEEKGSRPKVVVDGEEVKITSNTSNISKKTLDVYKFLISNPGFHGVRDLQKYMNYSSPGSVSYHLKRLMLYNLIIRTEEGKYGIYSEGTGSSELAKYMRLMLDTIPKYAYFAMVLIFSGFFVLIAGFLTSDNNYIITSAGSIIPIFVGSLLLRQSLEFAKNLEEVNQIVLDMGDD